MNRSLVAKKKSFPQIIFQPLNGPGQTGGGDIAFQAGTAEMKGRGQMPEQFKFSYIHGLAFYCS